MARFLTVFATVLSVRAVLGNHALAARVCALLRVDHMRVTSRGDSTRLKQESQVRALLDPSTGGLIGRRSLDRLLRFNPH